MKVPGTGGQAAPGSIGGRVAAIHMPKVAIDKNTTTSPFYAKGNKKQSGIRAARDYTAIGHVCLPYILSKFKG